jgi:tRNA dimethylallyltransferase
MSRVVALVGTTASGKSTAAHRAALVHGATEIVSLDAMSAYRRMDLGTAKPTPAERDEVRYHLVDVVDVDEELTVQRFQALCTDALDGIAARGHTALLVGGSGLYHRAVVDRLTIPPHDATVRATLEALAAAPGGAEALFAELEARDPLAASRMDPRNVRRTVRALEVVRATGRPFSSFVDELTGYPDTDVVQLGITLHPEAVDAAIAQRFERWMDAGLLEEVAGLLAAGGLSRTARQAAGYHQLLEHLEGAVPLSEAVANAIAATRRLARRQWRWFRRDPRIEWVDDADAAAAALVRVL